MKKLLVVLVFAMGLISPVFCFAETFVHEDAGSNDILQKGIIVDDMLHKDIKKTIDKAQKMLAPQCEYKIIGIEVKNIDRSNNKSKVSEEWKVLSCNKEIIYSVTLLPAASGGTDFEIETPSREAYKDMKN